MKSCLSPKVGKSFVLGLVMLALAGYASATLFRDGAVYNVGDQPDAVATADFNNDGHLDLVVGSYTHGNNLAILLGNGDGTFAKPLYISVAPILPQSVAAGDFNNDGIADLVVAGTGLYVLVYLGNGDGTFDFASKYPASLSLSVAVADLNGDGALDIAVANSGNATVQILLGKGDGSFLRPALYTLPLPYSTQHLVISDVNRDGYADVAVVLFCDPNLENCPNGEVAVLLNHGDGTFRRPLTFDVGGGPIGIVATDLNHDGKTDLMVSNGDFGFPSTVSVLQGNGDGTFRKAVDYPAGQGPDGLAAADFDGDGMVDLVVSNANDNHLSLFHGCCNGKFQPAISYGVGGVVPSIAVGDFNEDGAPDLALAILSGSSVQLLINAH